MTAAAGEQRTYPHGVSCWVDTDQPDVDAAIAFYAELFGWTFRDALPGAASDSGPGSPPTRYVIAQLDGRDAAAIGTGDHTASWHTFFAVDDVDGATSSLADLGASVTQDPVDAGPGGRTATLLDREGNRFHLWQPNRRLGAQVVNEPGAWNFSDLHTADAAAAEALYGPVFGWRTVDQGWSTAIQVPGYGDHLEATVDPDIRTRQQHAPEGFADVIGSLVTDPEGPTGWWVTFSVADRDASAATAERLGATILATDESDWVRTARIRDPQGAELTLSQFTPPEGW